MKNILVIGVDSMLADAYKLAQQIYPDRKVEKCFIPSRDYYSFTLSALECYSPEEWFVFFAVNEFYINDVRRALVIPPKNSSALK